jgi:hypothetical protein
MAISREQLFAAASTRLEYLRPMGKKYGSVAASVAS